MHDAKMQKSVGKEAKMKMENKTIIMAMGNKECQQSMTQMRDMDQLQMIP